MKRRSILFAGGAILFSAALLTAGPLDPPSGAIAPTYKTLQEVEPRTAISDATTPGDADSHFRIAKPGSYYLTQGLTVLPGKSGIEIASSNVTIDLGGFVIGNASTLPSIRLVGGGRTHLTIRNGTLNAGLGDAIDIAPNGAADADLTVGGLIEHINIANPAGAGIRAGNGIAIRNCSVFSAGAGGIITSSNATITGCMVGESTGLGIYTNQGAVITDTTVHTSSSYGIETVNSATIRGCTSMKNSAGGYKAGRGSTVVDCVSRENGTYGFFVTGSTVSACTASMDQYGFRLDWCTTSDCTAYDVNDTGFIVSEGTIRNSYAQSCGSSGFSGDNTSIFDCTAYANAGSGILLFYSSVARGNLCTDNGASGTGAGIEVRFDDNRLDGNTCVDNTIGVWIKATGNIVTRNTASGNSTNWNIFANNSVAPIVITNKTGSAINGDSGGGSLGSSDPSANFTY